MNVGLTLGDVIYNALCKSAAPLTRVEITQATGLSRATIRKPLLQMIRAGYLIQEVDTTTAGVEWISVNKDLPRVRRVPVVVPEPEPVVVPEPEPEPKPEPEPEPEPKPKPKRVVDKSTIGIDPMQEMYLQGYSEGYHAAMQISQREAFREGKRSVARKIATMLNIDMERILG